MAVLLEAGASLKITSYLLKLEFLATGDCVPGLVINVYFLINYEITVITSR